MTGVRPALSNAERRARFAAVSVLVVAIAVVVVLVRRSEDGTYELRASFDDVRGLIEGGDVRAGAVDVGTVSKIEIGPDERPLVTMKIDDDFRLHKGATADIRLASNVGAVNRTVELTEGDPSGPKLRDGALLDLRHTDQPVNFDDVMDTLTPRMRSDLGNLLGGLDDAVRGRGPDIDQTLRHSAPALNNTAAVLEELNRDGAALRTIVDDGDRVVSAIASRPNDLGGAADRLAAVLDVTAARRAEVSDTVRQLGPALTQGRVALDALADATPDLRRFVAAAAPTIDALGPFARLLPEATRTARPPAPADPPPGRGRAGPAPRDPPDRARGAAGHVEAHGRRAPGAAARSRPPGLRAGDRRRVPELRRHRGSL